jgi:hypothetical protein
MKNSQKHSKSRIELFIVGGVVAVFVIGGIVVLQVNNKNSQVPKPVATQQVLPVKTNPIQNTATQPGLAITAIAVEDNVDPVTKQAIADNLQISLHNSSNTTMSNVDVFYQMKDVTTGQTEAYSQKLTGFQLAPNETKTIFFDNQTSPGHYPENKYSLYRSSKNEVHFTVTVSAPGFRVATAETKKSVGTSEKHD